MCAEEVTQVSCGRVALFLRVHMLLENAVLGLHTVPCLTLLASHVAKISVIGKSCCLPVVSSVMFYCLGCVQVLPFLITMDT